MSVFWVVEDPIGRTCSWFAAPPKEAAKRLRATIRYLSQKNGRAPDLRLRKVSRQEFDRIEQEYDGRAYSVLLYIPGDAEERLS
jgi:hypothetical protein